jgi:hypothetical protein
MHAYLVFTLTLNILCKFNVHIGLYWHNVISEAICLIRVCQKHVLGIEESIPRNRFAGTSNRVVVPAQQAWNRFLGLHKRAQYFVWYVHLN